MSFFSRLTSLVMAVLIGIGIVVVPFVGPVYAQGPAIVGKAGILIDAKSGQVLYQKNPHQVLPPASTTKVLTAAIALEVGNLQDKVTISKNAATQEGSSIYLVEGETLTLEELVWAILLKSGNDASVAIAEHISGSVEEFTRLMNQKAMEWGAKNSNFCNPNGLPDENHNSTVYDLAVITKHAMQNPLFRKMTETKVKEIERVDPVAMKRLINHNKLLWRYEGATGVKTGYTKAAQQCLVSSAKRGEQELIVVVLGSVGNNIWTDSTALLDYGFKNYESIELTSQNRLVKEISVFEGIEPVRAITERDAYFTRRIGTEELPSEEVVVFKGLTAPVDKGQKMGYLAYSLEGQEVERIFLVADNAVDKKPVVIKRHPWILPTVGGTLFIGFVVLNRRRSYRRRRRYNSPFYRGPIR